MKQRVHALAEAQLVTESIWLKRLVATALRSSSDLDAAASENHGVRSVGVARRNAVVEEDFQDAPRVRVCIRLRPDDRLLLRERALARGMPSATYVSVLVRAHLRNLVPLPRDELVALKRSVGELGAVGRNLNQIARTANQVGQVAGPTREDLRAILKVCEALRDNVKVLIRTNVNTWEIGYAETES